MEITEHVLLRDWWRVRGERDGLPFAGVERHVEPGAQRVVRAASASPRWNERHNLAWFDASLYRPPAAVELTPTKARIELLSGLEQCEFADVQEGVLSTTEGADWLAMQGQRMEPARAVLRAKDADLPNGFLNAVLAAYNHHKELVLRPDDLLIAVVVALAHCTHTNNDKLKAKYGAPGGRKRVYTEHNPGDSLLRVVAGVFHATCDKLGGMDVAKRLLPEFTTTTTADRIAAYVAHLSGVRAFAEFESGLCCGLPAVTLMGTVGDWEKLHAQMEHVADMPCAAAEFAKYRGWAQSLRYVTENLLAARRGQTSLAFWSRICSITAWNSGEQSAGLTGWATLFAPFNTDGRLPWKEIWHKPETPWDGPVPLLMARRAEVASGVAEITLKYEGKNTRLIAGVAGFGIDGDRVHPVVTYGAARITAAPIVIKEGDDADENAWLSPTREYPGYVHAFVFGRQAMGKSVFGAYDSYFSWDSRPPGFAPPPKLRRDVMMHVWRGLCLHQNGFARRLLATGERDIVYVGADPFWACPSPDGANDRNNNMGRVLRDVRAKLVKFGDARWIKR